MHDTQGGTVASWLVQSWFEAWLRCSVLGQSDTVPLFIKVYK